MKSNVSLPPPGLFVKEDVYARKRWRRVQYLANQFWSRWRKEFLLNLQQRQKWDSIKRNLQIGDIVVLKEDDVNRNQWKLARIIEAIEDKDGLVRKTKIQISDSTLDKNGKRCNKLTILERPIQKLVLLLEQDNIV
jgi:hypothetical protein